jgi:dolichol kinase
MDNYWFNELLKVIVLYGLTYFLGLFVIKYGVRVNYTRKVFHFFLFFIPFLLTERLPFQASIFTLLMSDLIFLLWIGIFIEPIRARSVFLSTAYAAIDRPEDRPFTLLWLSTQFVATYVVVILLIAWLTQYEKQALMYILLLVAGIGDGLAEPIGIRFGRHKYRVKALFTDRTYTRSLEGSACVFLSALLAIFLLHQHFTPTQFVLALLVIPIAMTLAEAFSPHTWDGPILYLAGGISFVAILELSKLIQHA